jgi:LysR family transcriptional regulator, glycine cleavage system transcriptional activator
MNRRLVPPLHLLRAFVATANLGTISAAAVALHLTQGAVSKQVLELEQWLGTGLFERVRKRLRLTPSGQRYLHKVEPLLQQLEAATLDLVSGPPDGGVLHLSVLPTFSAKWLIPRLPDFQKRHPKVLLQFMPYVHGYDFTKPDLDCAIRYGDGAWPGAVAQYLVGRHMTLIAPPRRSGDLPLKRAADVVHHRLLQHVSVPQAWSDWCAAHRVAGINPHSGIQLDQYAVMVRAVAAGMGIALVPTCLVEDELARGEVRAPLPPPLGCHQAQAGYFLCYPENKAGLEPLVALRSWLEHTLAR